MATAPKPATDSTIQRPHVPWGVQRPSYFRCQRILRELRKFQDLIRYRERIDVEEALPLNTLLPKQTQSLTNNSWKTQQVIDREIQRLQIFVESSLFVMGVPLEVSFKHTEWDLEQQKEVTETHRYNLIGDYYQLQRENRHVHELIMEALEMGIGQYQLRSDRAKYQLVSPIEWIAFTLRLPIEIFERAGFLTTEEQHSKFVSVYETVARLLVLLILGGVATKFGLKPIWGSSSQLHQVRRS